MDPSKLTLQVSHSQNQENFVLGASAARGALNTSCGRPLFFGVPLPNSGRQNLIGTAIAGGSGGITQAAPCTGFPMFVPNAVHKNGVPRAAPSAFVSRAAEQLAGPSTQPSSNLPTGYSQVPINILVLHKRPEGSYSRPQLPLSQSFLLPPAMPGGPQDGAFVQRYPSHFLPLQRASNMISSNMASTPLGPAAPDKHKPVNAPVCSHQNGLEAEASTAGSETEACKLLQSATAVVDNSCSKPETLTTPGKAEGEQHQRPQEPARLVGEGSTEDSLQNYQSMQKKAKTQINQSDGPAFSVPTVPKECTITQLELHFSGTEQIQAFKIEKGTPGRKLKPRTKKHRPKVIREDRAAKARKPAVAAPKVKPLNQTVKRSYIRKKRSLSSLENTSGPVDDKSIPNGTGTAAEGSLGSVRRRLQPEHKEQAVGAEQTSMHHHQEKFPHPQGLEYPKLTVQIGQGLQLGMENSPGGLVFGLSRKLNEMLDEYIHLPEAAPEAPSAASGCFSKAVLMDNLRELAMKHGNISSTDHPHTTRQSMLHIEERTASMKQSKRDLENSSNVDGLQLYCSSQSLSEIESAWSQMSKAWQMEKRSHEHRNNGQFTSSGTGGSIILRTPAEMQAFCQAGGIKKKRSTRSRRLSFVPIKDLESNTSEASHRLPQSCMEALFESTYIKFMTKKRSQKARLHSPNSVEPIMEHKNRISTGSIFPGGSNISNASEGNWTPDNRSINPDIGCEVPNRSLASQSIVPYIDSLQSVAWKMKYLNLNSEQVHRTEMHLSVAASPTIFFREAADSPNAIVPYGGRVVVPYERPLQLVKKQRPRAKVDLDGETSRVWNLLMGKAADPVDGTDAEKEKWWEQERGVYQGRANSFIARMQLVQGDRHFSPWKGSVVDSVVGVFLTQNVSDHLSSSAFMALAASFPPRSINSNNKDNDSQENEEIISMNAAQHESVLDYFDDSVRLDVDVNHEGLSMINGKNHMEPKDNSFSTNELVKGENYPFYDKAPDGSLHNHQQTGVAPKAQKIAENSSVELAASTKNQQEIQFQELALSEAPSESILTSETILQSRLSLSSETDYAPGNFVGGLGIAVSQELESNSNDGKLSAGNNAPINEFQCQGIGAVARTDAGQPGVYSRSIIHPVISNIDHPQLDVRNDPHVSSTSPNSSSGSAPLNMANDTIDKSDSFFMPLDAYATKNSGNKTMDVTLNFLETSTEPPVKLHHGKRTGFEASDLLDNELFEMAPKADEPGLRSGISSSNGTPETAAYTSELKKTRASSRKNKDNFDWDSLRRQACSNYYMKERSSERRDSIDWEAVRCADVHKISHAIRERGMNNILADRIQNFLNRLVRDHGSIDLEWLRDIPPDLAKDYLLSIRGLGLKSVECVRLLTLHHLAFPVDTNVGRICVRLGWVPIQPLPESLQLHLLELYPVLETIQKFLWPRLCKLDQKTLYELHYHMITFGKVFCTKSKPNCNACPMRSECKHFASAYASARLALPAPQEKSLANLTNRPVFQNDHISTSNSTHLLQLEGRTHARDLANSSEPIIEEPASPREEECPGNLENEIEDFYEDPDEIPTIKLNMEAFAQNLEDCIKESNKDLQTEDIAKAIVAISSEAASIPVPKLKNVNRLRTEHYVYELPDSHPLLQQLELDQREPDDPCPYLLIVRMQDEIKETNKAPKPCCDSQVEGILCNNEMCHACVSERQNQSRYVRGTILIPCRTAMRGSFPLNGTYFQVNEVFAEHNSSHNPILVPREQLWNLHRRMVYFGTSVPTIFKGLATQEIQQCFWRGFVCVRGFDMGTRAPKPLCPQLHLVASRSRGTRKTAASEQKISFSGDDKHKVFLADRKEII